MVSPNKIKMVSNFNDEISMSDIFWREIMERKILWVPVVSCEKVYERIYVGMSMYRFISVSNVMCCMVFRQYNMKISGDLLMKIKIIIFKLIIIDLFIQGSFAARLIFCVFTFYRNINEMIWNLMPRIWTLREKEIWLLFGERWNRDITHYEVIKNVKTCIFLFLHDQKREKEIELLLME